MLLLVEVMTEQCNGSTQSGDGNIFSPFLQYTIGMSVI